MLGFEVSFRGKNYQVCVEKGISTIIFTQHSQQFGGNEVSLNISGLDTSEKKGKELRLVDELLEEGEEIILKVKNITDIEN